MAQVITLAGEKLFATKAQANQQLDIDTFIFANVAGQDPAAEIDRNEGIPTSAIVHQQNVQQTGRINDNVVVYSTVLDSVTGPFEFNWVGLYSSVNQTLVAISHVPTVAKTITAPGSAGNTLNRNFGIEYSGIADLAGISVSPETWQLDFSARLSGMDELTRQLAADMNGKDWFIGDGFKVVPRATAKTFSVTPGTGYVSGLRVELEQEHVLILQSYPQFVYVDAWFDGNASSQWKPKVTFDVTDQEKQDYIDANGAQHYVLKIAEITSETTVNDLRTIDGLYQKVVNAEKYQKANVEVQKAVQALKDGQDVNIVVFSDSTGDATNEWVYLLASKLSHDYDHTVKYYSWNIENNNYNMAIDVKNGNGATLSIWNAAIAGSTASRFSGDRLLKAFNNGEFEPDLVLVSYGHNGGNQIERQYSVHSNLVGTISRYAPFSPIVLIGQNPVLNDNSMAEKVNAFKALAKQTGCGFIDVHAMFKSLPLPMSQYYLDNVHPNELGSSAWAELVYSAFSFAHTEPSGMADSKLNGGVVSSLDTFVSLAQSSATNSATIEKEVVEFESRGNALKVIGTAENPFYYRELINSKDIKMYRGRYVSVLVRVKVASGSGALTGRIALHDGVNTITSSDGGPHGEDFYNQTLCIKVDPNATSLRVYVYIDAATNNDEIIIDRICLSDGLQAKDVGDIKELSALEFLRLLGANAKGVAVVKNINTGNTGIQVLDTNGEDDDDPETQYVVSVNSLGINIKNREDSHPRLIVKRDGGVYFGTGIADPTIRLQSMGAGLLRLLNAHLYPEDNLAWDFGIAGKAWRKGYIGELFLGDSDVRVIPGTGSPEGVITAKPGSIYMNKSGGAGQTFWVKEAGTGNTGWAAK